MRPTAEDLEALELLLAIDRIPETSALFLEGLAEREGTVVWSEKQCRWFDDLCEAYL